MAMKQTTKKIEWQYRFNGSGPWIPVGQKKIEKSCIFFRNLSSDPELINMLDLLEDKLNEVIDHINKEGKHE